MFIQILESFSEELLPPLADLCFIHKIHKMERKKAFISLISLGIKVIVRAIALTKTFIIAKTVR